MCVGEAVGMGRGHEAIRVNGHLSYSFQRLTQRSARPPWGEGKILPALGEASHFDALTTTVQFGTIFSYSPNAHHDPVLLRCLSRPLPTPTASWRPKSTTSTKWRPGALGDSLQVHRTIPTSIWLRPVRTLGGLLYRPSCAGVCRANSESSIERPSVSYLPLLVPLPLLSLFMCTA